MQSDNVGTICKFTVTNYISKNDTTQSNFSHLPVIYKTKNEQHNLWTFKQMAIRYKNSIARSFTEKQISDLHQLFKNKKWQKDKLYT